VAIMLGYITWDQYERNKCLIGENANMKGRWWPVRYAMGEVY
jgi:hypothetical protein